MHVFFSVLSREKKNSETISLTKLHILSFPDCESRAIAVSNQSLSFLCGSDGKESVCNAGDLGSIPGLGRPPGGGKPTPVFLPGESPWTEKPGELQSTGSESDATKHSTTKLYFILPLWTPKFYTFFKAYFKCPLFVDFIYCSHLQGSQ